MNRFRTRNPGKFKRKPETARIAKGIATGAWDIFKVPLLIVSMFIVGRWIGYGLFLTLKFFGVF